MSTKGEKKHLLNVYINKELITTFDMQTAGSSKYTIGRAKDNDLVIHSPIVSAHHATIHVENGQCKIIDENSTNGIIIDERKVTEQVLVNGMHILIDDMNNPHDEGIFILYSELENEQDEKWNEVYFKDKPSITIGRESSNDIALAHSLVSRKHAQIFVEKNDIFVKDLNSTNGTFLNGKPVKQVTKLKPLDMIYIGQTKFIVQENKILYNVHVKGLQIDAINISKTVVDSSGGLFAAKATKKILDNISISIKPGELVALIGGSGAGKSTFLDTLNGFRPATDGTVLVNGDDFYANYNAYKNILGYVPQQDIVYDTLTVQQMLIYAAKLRMPEDSSEAEILERVKEVIEDVELEGREDLVISQLSGGQRKRASIAVELLADPKLFFLDEPTSGLDPGMERNMMRLLRKLSNKGKTIILITHATANLHLCDKVVFLGYGGRLCYFGPPSGAQKFFEVTDYTDIYDLINKQAEKWQAKFVQSHYYSYYQTLTGKQAEKKPLQKGPSRSSLKQFAILSARYLKLSLVDKQRFFFLMIQAPIIAILMGLVAETDSFEYFETSKQVIFTVAASAVWIGLLNSIQEITKEKTIYKRERTVNLKLGPYISSKIVILGLMGLIQSVIFVAIFTAIIELPTENLLGYVPIEIFMTFFLSVLASTAMGLVVSCLVANSDRAMGLAPILLVPQLIFNGLVFELEGVTDWLSNLAIAKWTARAFSISFDLNDKPMELETKVALPQRDLPEYYDHSLSLLYQNWGILLGITVLCTVISIVILKRKDRQ
ncbi:FHA domain-containing protein [Metabacillus malikii]|nr:FHA domain-containing protein [Metabacillus malikii]